MKRNFSFIKDFGYYFLLPISLFILFKSSIDKLLTNFIVNPILSNCCTPPKIIYDLAAFIIAIIFLIPILYKLTNGAKISIRWIFILTSYLVIYIIYRVLNTPFLFTSSFLIFRVKLLDILNLVPLITVVGSCINSREREPLTMESANGFAVDEPIKIDANNDLLNRNKFISVIANKIKNTETYNGSFTIGVVAKWGTGKTTFINSLLDKFSDDEIIKIELNVWKCNNNTQLVEALFNELRGALKDFSFTIDNRLQDYTTNLLKGTKNEGLNSIKNLFEIFLPDRSLVKKFESVNEEVKRIGKKVVVVIDDLDRLDKKEIYEVIRLVRNTANFANTFFVVAYDRNYILNAIEEINPYQSHYFLEKIFQVEFSIPVISDSILQSEIRKRIEPFLTEEGGKGYKMLQERGFTFYKYSDADFTTSYIHNMRDVVRFVNAFKLDYEFIKDEVYFPDFYNLELIKFKHPELFSMVYNERYKIFTTDDDNTKQSSTYSLQKVYRNGKKTQMFELKKFIEENKDALKLNGKDIDTICISMSSIFPDSINVLHSVRKSLNYHLSVINPSMFDRYFILGIEGKLSEIDFSKMRRLPYNDFIEELEKLAIKRNLAYELAERFERVKDFDNKDDFEKILKGIFHLANLRTHANTNYFAGVGYNGKNLSEIIGNEKNVKFYNDIREYKEFILHSLNTDSLKYTYTNDYVSSLLHDNIYYIKGILAKEEISEILLDNFKNALAISDRFNIQLWWHFMRCEIREEVLGGGGITNITYRPNEEALKLMRNFILQKDLDGFLLFSVRQAISSRTFIIEDSIKYIFRENEYFIRLINLYKLRSKYREEFTKFYFALKNDPKFSIEGVPLDFFKVMPVKYRDEQ